MKSFSVNFELEKNKKTGASPVWILKCPFASGTVYLSDQVVTVAGWDGSITTKSWVESWGQINEDIGAQLSLARVADFSLNIINDPNAVTNIEAIFDDGSNNIETTDCELYLWFIGLDASTDPPYNIWTGNIIDWTKEDELKFKIELVDQSVRLDKYIGTRITSSDYPSADPDDLGKIGNIGYGTVKKIPARAIVAGALDYLDAWITDIQTTLNLVDAAEFPTSGTIGIDEEEISYTGKTGNQLTGCTRGVNLTTAAPHTRGAVTWEVRSDFTYEAFSHPIKAFDDIYAEGGDTRLKITSICTLYTGQSGDEHSTWPARAIVVVPSKITKSQAVDLLINDGITIDNAISLIDGITVEDTIDIIDLLTIGDNINVSNPAHGHGLTPGATTIKQIPNSPAIPTVCTGSGSWSFNSVSNVIDAVYSITVDWGNVTFSILGISINVPGETFFTRSDAPGSVSWSGAGGGTLASISRDVRRTQSADSSTQNTSKTGNAYRGGSVSKGGGASKGGTVNLSGSVTRAGEVTMTGNSVVNAVVADKLLVDAQTYMDDASGTFTGVANAIIERPDHVIKHFLNTYAAWPVANFYTDAASEFDAAGYVFSGVITEYKKLKEWLRVMAFQCRCFFRMHAGKANLTWRPDSLNSDKTVTASMIRMKADSKTTTRVSRSALTEVINKLAIYYDRDWSKGGVGKDAYMGISEAIDTASVTKYGEKEQPNLFYFDFVKAQAMAQDLRDFYIARYKDRRKVVSMSVFLDNSELEFGDGITITSLASLLAEVQKVDIRPGSGRQMRNDMIQLVAKEY